MGNIDKPVITMYKYIEKTRIHQFIRYIIETNLEAFENESCCLNDYHGISISSGSSIGKMRHGFETINIIKDLKQIQDGSFEVIHIFVQIFPESSLVHFDKRPLCNPSTRCYPCDSSHLQKFDNPGHLSVTDYNVYDVYMTPMDIENSLDFMDSIIELLKMKRPFASAKQAKEILRFFVNWVKIKYSINRWLDCVGGKKDPKEITDEKRKKIILMLIF
ncbi:13180_t:CDS:2 [Funneliformis geosporum]|nr:13180_t:CDS:2 [Funneliformis geosporum]